MSNDRILVAGASGALGREVVQELKTRGYCVRALGRTPARLESLRGVADELVVADALRPATLRPALEGVTRVFSCLGASVIPRFHYGRAPFSAVDYPANRNLIEASVKAGVEKFVYVSVFGAERLPQMDFVRGHELVVQALRASGMDYAVLRPTGFFSAMEEIVLVASRGLLPEFRGGTARTNPIHEADLALACVEALESAEKRIEQDLGGPDALTRKEIARLAFGAMGREGRMVRVPVGVLRGAGLLLRPLNPRVGHLMTFITEVLIADFVAPPYGTHHLADYFASRAEALQRPRTRL